MTAERLTDLVQALTDGVHFDLDGRTYRVPARPLAVWLRALIDARPDAIVPALLEDEDAAGLYDRLLADLEDPGLLDSEVCEEIGRWIVEQLTGRPWWEVVRLTRTGLETWNALDGWCLDRGLDPAVMDLRRFCNAVFKFAIGAFRDQAEREAWVEQLRQPPSPAALADRPEWSDEGTAESFDAVFASFGG